MIVEVINKSNNPLPEYKDFWDAGADVRANLGEGESICIQPHERALIPTGLYFSIPQGYEIQVRPRSGLALKNGITVLNSPGTIDSSYKGELGIILINTSDMVFRVNSGDRIAQIVLKTVEHIEWSEVLEFTDKTDRGGGFGHTGIK